MLRNDTPLCAAPLCNASSWMQAWCLAQQHPIVCSSAVYMQIAPIIMVLHPITPCAQPRCVNANSWIPVVHMQISGCSSAA